MNKAKFIKWFRNYPSKYWDDILEIMERDDLVFITQDNDCDPYPVAVEDKGGFIIERFETYVGALDFCDALDLEIERGSK